MLGRRRLFAAALIVTLALGIGANAAIFTLVRAVLLRPLPYVEPERLVFAWLERSGRPIVHERHGILTGTFVLEWMRRIPALESVAVISSWSNNPTDSLDLMTADGAERLRGAFVTPNFFELLGAGAAVGRTFDSRDLVDGTPLVVISDAFWRRRFAGDSAVIGQTVDLMRGRGERQRYTIVGVLPPAFKFTYPLETEVWGMLPWSRVVPSQSLDYEMVARLTPAATIEQAQGELTGIAQEIFRGFGFSEDQVREQYALVESLGEHLAAESRPGLLLLAAAAGVVMLIGCVNVALLLLALLVDRRREMALRSALGARPGQLAQQLLSEGALLGVVAAVIGLTAAWLTLPVLRALVPPMVPRGDELVLDPVVLAFAAAVALGSALLSSLMPAWHARRRDVQADLRLSSGSATGEHRLLAYRRAVVVAQVAIVLMLLVGAALLLRSYWRIHNIDPGFAGEGVITMEMRLLNPKYRQPGRVADFQRRVLDEVRALPGVEQASMTSAVPLRGVDFAYMVRPVGGTTLKAANMRSIDPEYFSLMRIPLVAGRAFTAADDEAAPRVAIVSESYGRELFGDASPLGKYLELKEPAEIVGVVADVRHAAVTKEAFPGLYLPRAQQPIELICLVVRPSPGVQGIGAAVRRVIQDIDPEQPVEGLTTLDRIVRESTAEERFQTVVVAAFALTAVLLAMAGVAGVVARSVTERERELALRMALGAEPGRLRRMAVRQGLYPVGLGIVVGLLGAWLTSRLMQRFLFDVSPLDAVAYVAAVTALAAVAMLACYLPARRATQIDPIVALKSE